MPYSNGLLLLCIDFIDVLLSIYQLLVISVQILILLKNKMNFDLILLLLTLKTNMFIEIFTFLLLLHKILLQF